MTVVGEVKALIQDTREDKVRKRDRDITGYKKHIYGGS